MTTKITLASILILLFSGVKSQSGTQTQYGVQLTYSQSPSIPDAYYFELNNLPALQAPAFYSYFWWMGDNGFSFAEYPHYSFQHEWENNTNRILAITTDNYGTSGPPPLAYAFTRSIVGNTPLSIIPAEKNIYMQNYRNPVIGDTLYLIVSYKSPTEEGFVSGTLSLDLPDNTQLISNMFTSYPELLPNGEFYMTNTSTNIEKWSFEDLETEKERSILLPIKILPGVEEELTFKISLEVEGHEFEGEPTKGVAFSTLELPVVASHDPNRMLEQSNAEFDCEYGGKPINYTVQFQNNGEGPTDSVKVISYLDKKLDLNSISITKIPNVYNHTFSSNVNDYPRANYKIDRDRNTISFNFYGLKLLSTQMDSTVMDLAYTKSELAFTINLRPNYVFGDTVRTRSLIYFDDNSPISTSVVKTICKEARPIGNGGGFIIPPPTSVSTPPWRNSIIVGAIALIAVVSIVIGIRIRRRKK